MPVGYTNLRNPIITENNLLSASFESSFFTFNLSTLNIVNFFQCDSTCNGIVNFYENVFTYSGKNMYHFLPLEEDSMIQYSFDENITSICKLRRDQLLVLLQTKVDYFIISSNNIFNSANLKESDHCL